MKDNYTLKPWEKIKYLSDHPLTQMVHILDCALFDDMLYKCGNARTT